MFYEEKKTKRNPYTYIHYTLYPISSIYTMFRRRGRFAGLARQAAGVANGMASGASSGVTTGVASSLASRAIAGKVCRLFFTW